MILIIEEAIEDRQQLCKPYITKSGMDHRVRPKPQMFSVFQPTEL